MQQKNYYIIDFDSTFTQVEALDELARISLKNKPDREEILKKIQDYTNMAMGGALSFSESLTKRVQLLEANKDHLKKLVAYLKKKISPSFSRNASFFKEHADDVLIVSGGFKEFIIPVVKKFNIKKGNVYANTFLFNDRGQITGYDATNPLCEEGGKIKLIRQLNLRGQLLGIGDGYSDFQLRESGMVQKFFAYTENIARKTVIAGADHITPNFDEFLYINKLPGAISYPKNRIICITSGSLPEESIAPFVQEGFSVINETEADEKTISRAGILLIAQSKVPSDELFQNASRLKAIGYFGNARKDLRLSPLTEKGILVFDGSKNTSDRNQLLIPGRIIQFINKGAVSACSNFPNLQLPAVSQTHRIIHIHKNVPGVIAEINTILARHHINIRSQYLMTNALVGYVIIDIAREYDKKLLKELKKTEHTLRFRILY